MIKNSYENLNKINYENLNAIVDENDFEINYENFKQNDFLTNCDFETARPIQKKLMQILDIVEFPIFLTINLNINEVSTSRFENGMRFATQIIRSIQNDFPQPFLNGIKLRSRYFLRPVFSGSQHYHALIHLPVYKRFKNCRTGKFPLPLINDDALKIYGTTKCIEDFDGENKINWSEGKNDFLFPAARYHMALLKPHQQAAKNYVIFNRHNPQNYNGIDVTRFCLGNSAFCYQTDIFEKKGNAPIKWGSPI